MTADHDEIATLRLALATAERTRDDALRAAAAAEARHRDERREEQHRLRNMFSVIRLIARRTSEDVTTVEDYRGVLDGRLSSYLGLQAIVAQDWYQGSDLGLLVANELLIFGLKEGDRVELAGPAVRLTSRAAILVGLAYHELASAAIATGRLDEPGRLRVNWSVSTDGPEQHQLIDWIEAGPDAREPDTPPSSWAEWIERAIAHQLGGSVSMAIDGEQRLTRIRLPSSAMA